ncbi:MAG: SRPBCC family protein [Myxococcales bacterium]|nr:SRPBCC family protein [Myxococcales bacterium]
MIGYSITKSIAIEAPRDRVFVFLADAANWPQWAIVNVASVKPADDQWWDMETPGGTAKLRIRANAEFGILDHDFVAPDASWTVPARVVPNGSGCEFMITFFQPPGFTRQFFEEQVALVDKELAQLKSIMEST